MAHAETDSAGAPLLLRRTGVLYDEHGIVTDESGREPRACHIEMFPHYYRITPGIGLTYPEGQRLFDLSTSTSTESLTVVNYGGLYIASLPVTSKVGGVAGRTFLAGMVIDEGVSERNYLNLLSFEGDTLTQYEVRILVPQGHEDSPRTSAGDRPASIRHQRTAWNKPNYFLYARCVFETPVS